MPDVLSDRARLSVAAARQLLEEEGPDTLTMRRLAERMGIRAPSLYKHFADKAAVEAQLIAQGMAELAEALEAAEAAAPPGAVLSALAGAYRAYALAHPHLYRLMTSGPLPRDLLPEGLEERSALPLARAVGGDADRARALWAFGHGMVVLELDGRFPPGADLAPAWSAGLAAYAGP